MKNGGADFSKINNYIKTFFLCELYSCGTTTTAVVFIIITINDPFGFVESCQSQKG